MVRTALEDESVLACVRVYHYFFFVDVLMKPGSLLEQKRKHSVEKT